MNSLRQLNRRLASLPRDLACFIATVVAAGFADSIFNSIFNNYLNDTFRLNSYYRTFLELPRELGGFLVVFAAATLYFLRSRRLALVATFCAATGLALMALFSVSLHWMFLWLFIFSLGQHLFMPLYTSIGMELAREGQTGRRLGQFNALRNLAIILGGFFTLLGFKYLHFNFRIAFLIAGFFYLLSSVMLYAMHPGKAHLPAVHLQLHREYRLYYWLSILFGTRKQIFLTFAPWVLVTVFHQPTAMLATLLTVAGIAGILFQPLLGRAIDKFGEKNVLALEAACLVLVCSGYGFSRNLFSERTAFIIASICFVADQLLMSVNMARSTYLKKIAVHPDHVTPTLTMSVSLDHVFSITIALLGGLIWSKWGYQMVFVLGAGIALVNLVSVQFIRIPESTANQRAAQPPDPIASSAGA
jgi:predicted MFS family arabinose efflux permease